MTDAMHVVYEGRATVGVGDGGCVVPVSARSVDRANGPLTPVTLRVDAGGVDDVEGFRHSRRSDLGRRLSA